MRKEWKAQEEPARELAEGTRVYVGNMPYNAQKMDVEALFKAFGFDVLNIDISIDPFTNRNPSYCFVDLGTPDAATSAMNTLTGNKQLGRSLKVQPCVQKRRHNDPNNTHSTGLIFTRWRDRSLSSTKARPTHPDSFSPIHQNCRVYLGGLPKPLDQHTSDLEIRTLFETFAVEAVSKVKSPSGSTSHVHGNQWYAFVDFSSEEEAERAVKQLDGTERWGGKLSVHLSRRTSG